METNGLLKKKLSTSLRDVAHMDKAIASDQECVYTGYMDGNWHNWRSIIFWGTENMHLFPQRMTYETERKNCFCHQKLKKEIHRNTTGCHSFQLHIWDIILVIYV